MMDLKKKELNKKYRLVLEQKKQLEKELKNTKKKTISKDWFIKVEEFKSNISDYQSNILFFFTLFLTIVTIKPNPTILIDFPNLRWIISGILFLMLTFQWKKNYWENKIADHFKKKEAKSFWWRYGSVIFMTVILILLILWIFNNKNCLLYLIAVLSVLYSILKFIFWLRKKTQS